MRVTSSEALELLEMPDLRFHLLSQVAKDQSNALKALNNSIVTSKEERLYLLDRLSFDSLRDFMLHNDLLPDERGLILERAKENGSNALNFIRIVKDITDLERAKLCRTICKSYGSMLQVYEYNLIGKFNNQERKMIQKCLNSNEIASRYLSACELYEEERAIAVQTLLKHGNSSLELLREYSPILKPEERALALSKVTSTKTTLLSLILNGNIMFNLADKKTIVDAALKSDKLDICEIVYNSIDLPKSFRDKLEPYVMARKLIK